MSQATKLPPIADAGSDQIIMLPVDSVTLTGKGIDPDGSVISYSWKYLSGPVAFTIANANSVITKVNNWLREYMCLNWLLEIMTDLPVRMK